MRHFRYSAFSPNKAGSFLHLKAVASKVYLLNLLNEKCLLHSLMCIFDSIIATPPLPQKWTLSRFHTMMIIM